MTEDLSSVWEAVNRRLRQLEHDNEILLEQNEKLRREQTLRATKQQASYVADFARREKKRADFAVARCEVLARKLKAAENGG